MVTVLIYIVYLSEELFFFLTQLNDKGAIYYLALPPWLHSTV